MPGSKSAKSSSPIKKTEPKPKTNPKPKPLVIKSVCDLADENKSDDIQDYAAYTSAQVLYEFALRYL